VIQIPLTRGLVAIVDDEDAYLAEHEWYAIPANKQKTKFYAVRGEWVDGKLKRFWLHREVLKASEGVEVDHEDNDGLNCRRSNLRLATHAQNQRNKVRLRNNRSGYKGVYKRWDPRPSPWGAHIRVNGKLKKLGYHATPEEAARAYDRAARELFGSFAKLNFPEET
jgi:hypothetical protein